MDKKKVFWFAVGVVVLVALNTHFGWVVL